MHKRGLSSIIITTLIIVIALGAVSILYTATKPLLEKTADSSSHNCLQITLIPESCIYDEEFISLRISRGRGGEELSQVKFLIKTDEEDIAIDRTGSPFTPLETHTIQIARDLVPHEPREFDVAPMIGTTLCAPTNSPIPCQEGDPPAPNILLTACMDGEDNDGDGWIDYDGAGQSNKKDPGCDNGEDTSEENSVLTQCSDGIDNDGLNGYDGNDEEGCTDWQDDKEESDMSLPACDDGMDNDGDGLIDYPIDDGCIDTLSAETAQAHTKDNLYAYAWDGQDTYTYVLRTAMIASYHENEWRTNNVNILAQKLSEMPEGHRALIEWDLLGGNQPAGIGGDDPGYPPGADPILFNNPGDRCKDASGQTTPYPCPWLDAGVATAQQRYRTFLDAYTSNQQRPAIDVIILDMEMGFSIWSICTNPGANPDARCIARFNAIWNDPRSTTSGLKAELEQAIGPMTNFSSIYARRGGPERGDDLVWDGIMGRMIVDYKEEASYDIAKTYYPSIKMSNYGDAHFSKQHSFPHRLGINFTYYDSGDHLGTHQGNYFYMGHFGVLCTNTAGYLYWYWDPTCAPHGTRYEDTAFNGLKYDVNLFHASAIASSHPHIPWISHKPYEDNLARNSDIYQEHIMHMTLNGADDFILWNPHGPTATHATDDSDLLVENTLKEINLLAGFEGLQPLNNQRIENWNNDYVISGAQTGERKVWRVTPKSMSAQLVQTEENIIITTQENIITLPEGVLYVPQEGSVSSAGYWIIQPKNAAAPLIQRR